MNDYVSIGQAAALIGVAVVTLRRWEKEGRLLSSFRTFGNHRRYKVSDVLLLVSDDEPRVNICYSRVSSHDQKADLHRQSEVLKRHCEEQGLIYEVIQDLGSGLNFKKKGLNRLITLIISKRIDTIFLTHKDRLLRFGSDLIINIAHKFGSKVVVLNDKKQTFEEQLASDVLEIITVFSAKLYGSRSNKKKIEAK